MAETEQLVGPLVPALPPSAERAVGLRDRLQVSVSDLRWMVRPILGTRLIVWVAALAFIAVFRLDADSIFPSDPNWLTQPFHSVALNRFIAPAGRWDSVWYLTIAAHGYSSPPTTAFFPLYPLLLALGSQIVDVPMAVGLFISSTCMIVAFALLYRLARLDLNERAARLSVLLVAFFPTSLFFTAVYTESLFLMLSIGAIYAARRERWALAGVCGALAAATHINGVLILLPLLFMYLYGPRAVAANAGAAQRWRPRYPLRPSVLWLALVPVGLTAFFAYLGITHGAPLETLRVERVLWGHQFFGPFGGLVKAVIQLPGDLTSVIGGTATPLGPGDPLSWNAHELIDLAFVVLAAIALRLSWGRIPPAYMVYSGLMLMSALSDPTRHEPVTSFSRYMLTIFPLFIGTASRLAEHRRLTAATLIVSGTLLAVFSGLWGIWAWVA